MAVFMAGYPLIALILMMTGSVREFYSSSAQDQFADDMERAEDDRRRDEECDDRRRDEGGDDRIRGDHDR